LPEGVVGVCSRARISGDGIEPDVSGSHPPDGKVFAESPETAGGIPAMRTNELRERIDSGDVSIGTRMQTQWPGLLEILGQTDVFDYVEFLAEYAPYDLRDFENMARAAELGGLSMMIKLDAESRGYFAQRAMAAGIQNLLFADVRTVEDAREAVAAVRPEPGGNNGVRSDRRNGYVGGYGSPGDVVEWCEDAVIAIMVEKEETVDNIEEILAVEGIDMVQFGPADYSLSIGEPGEYDHPDVQQAEMTTIETALDAGVAPRAEINHPAEAAEYLDLGVRDFNLNTDTRILHNWYSEYGSELAEEVADASR
jgi:2-keto-3-deoxy-L-rhamnonate aldolase RhmA